MEKWAKVKDGKVLEVLEDEIVLSEGEQADGVRLQRIEDDAAAGDEAPEPEPA